MDINFVAPVTIRAASTCIFSNSLALYYIQLSQTTLEYSITGLMKEK